MFGHSEQYVFQDLLDRSREILVSAVQRLRFSTRGTSEKSLKPSGGHAKSNAVVEVVITKGEGAVGSN